jgi:CRISPR-associated endonuclease/helicase Cas3
MNVIFVSESQGKAEKRVRKVLDRYAARIGSATWIAALTEEGLEDVRRELREGASKSTAVACHRVSSRREIALAWIVGSRKLFNRKGEIRVHETGRGLLYEDREPTPRQRVLCLLAMLAGLLHDLGKANAAFQAKLRSDKPRADAARHELVSVLILRRALAFEKLEKDEDWLARLADGDGWAALQGQALFEPWDAGNGKSGVVNANAALPFPDPNKTPLLFALCWLMLSHHRLPYFNGHEYAGKHYLESKKSVGTGANARAKADENAAVDIASCAKLAENAPDADIPWKQGEFRSQAGKLAKRLRVMLADLPDAAPSLDAVMLYGRMGFQMADHRISSADEAIPYESGNSPLSAPGLFANTIRINKIAHFRQRLPDHLLRVGAEAGKTVQLLYGLGKRLPCIALEDLPERLRVASVDPRYRWQDWAANAARETEGIAEAGFFGVLMAGTGSGKTIAAPKIMAAASEGLRLVYASALRSLTLQTGAALREDIGFGPEQMGVIVGSELAKKLFESAQEERKRAAREQETPADWEAEGVEAAEFDEAFELVGGGGDWETDPRLEELLRDLFKGQPKTRRFILTPVLSATLDSIMKIADARRGGHIAHGLRAMSSDLILDEADLYGVEDLVAIGRLAFQVGLAGRKLLISSATLPPPLAQALFAAYRRGYVEHCALFDKPLRVYAGWFADGAQAQDCVKLIACAEEAAFAAAHREFAEALASRLQSLPPKRSIRRFAEPGALTEEALFAAVFEACLELHRAHHTADAKTGRRFSIGAVQWGRVRPCIDFARYAANRAAEEGVEHFILCHHARFFLAVREAIEQDLDAMLRRKDDPDKPLQHKRIREILESGAAADVVAIISTTLESTGRDHDFDWGVAEPTSARTLVQFAGRIRRHREIEAGAADTLIVMAYPLRHIENRGANRPSYRWPGPETLAEAGKAAYRLAGPLAKDALGESAVHAGWSIREYPALVAAESVCRARTLAELEQQKLRDILGAGLAEGYLDGDARRRLACNSAEKYRFRRSEKQCLFWLDEDGYWRACENPADGASVAAWDRESTIGEVKRERFLLRHGDAANALHEKALHDLGERDGPVMRGLLLGISLDARKAGKIRFHPLLGLDGWASESP